MPYLNTLKRTPHMHAHTQREYIEINNKTPRLVPLIPAHQNILGSPSSPDILRPPDMLKVQF